MGRWEGSVMLRSLKEFQEPLSTMSMCMKMSMKMASRCSITMMATILLLGCVCKMSDASPSVGGIHDIPDFEHKKEIQDLGHFAVDEYNTEKNVGISFSKVVKAQEQVVTGMMYYLTIETNDGSKTKLYAAKIWVKPWQKFKKLEDFKPV